MLDFGISKVSAAAAQISQRGRSARDPLLHGARAGARAGRRHRRPHRSVRAGRDRVPDADRHGSVSGRRHRRPCCTRSSTRIRRRCRCSCRPAGTPRPLQTVLDRALAKRPRAALRRDDGARARFRGRGRAHDWAPGRGGPGRPGRGGPGRAWMAVRLDDAEIDPPPPVRTPAPLVLRPIRPIADADTGAAVATADTRRQAAPATPMAPQMDWEVPHDVDQLPKRTRGVAVLGCWRSAAVALLIVDRLVPKAAGGVAASRARKFTSGRARPDRRPRPRVDRRRRPRRPRRPTPREAAPTQRRPTRRCRAGNRRAAATAAPPAAARRQPPPRRRRPPRPQRAAPAAPAPQPRAHRRPADPQPRAAARGAVVRRRRPPPAAARSRAVQITPPANPPLDGRAFEIAPPTTDRPPARDLAPPERRSAVGRRPPGRAAGRAEVAAD